MLIGELPWPPHLGDEGAGQRRDTVLGTHTPSCRPLAEFRCRAIELAREKTKPVLELAKELRISESCLRNWMAQANVDGNGSPTQLASKEKKELVKLRRDKRRLDIECWGP